eukprot:g7014.t1
MLRKTVYPSPLLRQFLHPIEHGPTRWKHGIVVTAKRSNQSTNKYSPTVLLPETSFGMRANSLIREPEIQSFWEEHRIYESLLEGNLDGNFTLHDGPPYANGDLHIGHALNKILKDFINRYQLLCGKRAKFVPGWDTHGLPIELKVLQTLSSGEKRSLSALEFRSKAAEFAVSTMKKQMEQFQRYGVWASWTEPYLTLQCSYESAQLELFAKMVRDGHIYRGRKPVHWSPSSRTALAESELEYPDGHLSESCFVALEVVDDHGLFNGLKTHLAIWTTTPWTIPANRAVAVNGDLDYTVLDQVDTSGINRLIVASQLAEGLMEKLGSSTARQSWNGKGTELLGLKYRHPFEQDRVQSVVLGGDYITTESGTGLVHTAPGHGQEDYIVGLKHGLEIYSPVDESGTFTTEAGGKFAGKKVLSDGNQAVLEELGALGLLLKQEPYGHKYPYDWRTKKPIIYRATDQWFASIEAFRETALSAIKEVDWFPSVGINRITAMTKSRSDWCISRQRRWGVPIPAFYDIDSDEPFMTEASILHFKNIVAEQGTDAWWSLPVEELLPPQDRDRAHRLRRGEDTMDVWFDSGSSWAAVLQQDNGLDYPADLYLEGSDQHRGWFQSSLLTSVAVNGVAPYKQVLTHGFVLDDRGRKMSKSLGNVLDPLFVIQGGNNQKQEPPYGADVLRLWVASVDYTSDVMIGKGILRQVADVYKKIRGTLRFLLGNLHDFDPETNSVQINQLPALDGFILGRFYQLSHQVEAAYSSYQFPKFFSTIQRFVTSDLSNFYLDIAKDRLYIQSKDSYSRRSCQTVLHELLLGLMSYIAPILPHLAEDVWYHLPFSKQHTSVFQAGWKLAEKEWSQTQSKQQIEVWERVLQLREMVTKVLETARESKFIGSSLEAKILVHVPDSTDFNLVFSDNSVDELQYVFIVSQAEWSTREEAINADFHRQGTIEGIGEVTIGVQKALGLKCERCWNYSPTVGQDAQFPDLCHRCSPVVKELEFEIESPESSEMLTKS